MDINEINNRLASAVKRFVEQELSRKETLPENFDSVVVDVRETDYGKKCHIYFLFNSLMSGYQMNLMRPIEIVVKRSIRNLFDNIFKGGVYSSLETKEYYNESIPRLDESKKSLKIEINKDKLNNVILTYLNRNMTPDMNWGLKFSDFYKKEIEDYGIIDFFVDEKWVFTYYGKQHLKIEPNTLEITRGTSEELNSMFDKHWVDVFRDWFEKNTGLEVENISRFLDF